MYFYSEGDICIGYNQIYIDSVHRSFIFCSKGDSLQISVVLRLHQQSAVARKLNRLIGTIRRSAYTIIHALGQPIFRP
jgi:hypothetical protein